VLGYTERGIGSRFGRVVQPDGTKRVLVNARCPNYAGGPVVDSEGKVVGCVCWSYPERELIEVQSLRGALQSMSVRRASALACNGTEVEQEREERKSIKQRAKTL
jgi:hypothetical protein